MQHFTGKEYIKIDVANHFGFDKEPWEARIKWFDMMEDIIPMYLDQAEDKMLAHKGWYAWQDAKAGVPTGFIMGCDATASGLQVMAALIGCHNTAANVNLIDTGKREDIYEKIAFIMNTKHGCDVDRNIVKKPIMTTFYGSVNQPKEVFGADTPELAAFYDALNEELPGAMEVMEDIQGCWNPTVDEYKWQLPDGHTAVMKVIDKESKKIEVDELGGVKFTHRATVIKPLKKGLSLAANVVHSIDGYIVREMVRKAKKAGFQLAAIHDSFWSHPNHINEVRQFYNEILAEIADSTLLQDILNQITGSNGVMVKYTKNLSNKILQANYSLS